MQINSEFEEWAKTYSGCDGGNLDGKIWLCGIEWGGGHNPATLDFQTELQVLRTSIPCRTPDDTSRILRNENRKNTYDLNAYKLLSVIQERNSLSQFQYKECIERLRPFEQNSNYFKLNLYPISFKITSDNLWDENWKAKTGIESKYLYRLWCWKHRFSFFKKLVEKHNPKLVICVGKTYTTDFLLAFEGLEEITLSQNITIEKIEEDGLIWLKINKGKTLLCITPFLTNAGNLVGDDKISKYGIRISEILGEG